MLKHIRLPGWLTLTSTLPAFALLTLALLPGISQAANGWQDLPQLRQLATHWLQQQTTGLPGQVNVQVGAIDPKLKLANCVAPDVFLPAGSRAWGKTSLGIRCAESSPWTIYLQAEVSVIGQYLVTATPLMQGQVITAQDLVFQSGDLSKLPPGVLTDLSQAAGRSVNVALMAGAMLRPEQLRMQTVIKQGQTVRLNSTGKGFSISAEGAAMGNAGDGQTVQVKVAGGQIVSGVARGNGVVEVAF